MRAALSAVVLCALLSACTYVFTRDYIVEPVGKASPEEVERVFQAFSEFLQKRGYPVAYQARPESGMARYRIGGTFEGVGQHRDYEDILELRYEGGSNFRLKLSRFVHRNMDFSDDYLRGFLDTTERFIREATSKPVRIRPVPTGRT
jgi:hypothetical protein